MISDSLLRTQLMKVMPGAKVFEDIGKDYEFRVECDGIHLKVMMDTPDANFRGDYSNENNCNSYFRDVNDFFKHIQNKDIFKLQIKGDKFKLKFTIDTLQMGKREIEVDVPKRRLNQILLVDLQTRRIARRTLNLQAQLKKLAKENILLKQHIRAVDEYSRSVKKQLKSQIIATKQQIKELKESMGNIPSQMLNNGGSQSRSVENLQRKLKQQVQRLQKLIRMKIQEEQAERKEEINEIFSQIKKIPVIGNKISPQEKQSELRDIKAELGFLIEQLKEKNIVFMENKFQKITRERMKNSLHSIDLSTPFHHYFQVQREKNIKMVKSESKYIQILSKVGFSSEDKSVSFASRIVTTKQKYITIGIVDANIQRNERKSSDSGYAVCYSGYNGGVHAGVGQNNKYEWFRMGNGFSSGDLVTVEIHFHRQKVVWIVNNQKKAEATSKMLSQHSRKFVAFWEMWDIGDEVQFYI